MNATSSNSMVLTLPSDKEIVMTRVFNAPRELVFDATTKPEHLKHWWGPSSLELTVCEADLRPGGQYRFVQRDADGNEFPFKGEFREIERPGRVVMTQIFDMEPFNQDAALVTIELTEEEGKTRLTGTMLFSSKEARDGAIQSGMEHGARESYDRLAELLETLQR